MKKRIIMILVALFIFFPLVGVKADDTIELTEAMFDAAYMAGEGNTTNHITYHVESEIPWFELEPGNYTLTENIHHSNVYFASGNSTLNFNTFRFDNLEVRSGATLTIDATLGGVNQQLDVKSGATATINRGIYNNLISSGVLNLKDILVDGSVTSKPNSTVTISGGEYHQLVVDGGKVTVKDALVNDNSSPAEYGVFVKAGEIEIEDGTFHGPGAGLFAEKDGENIKSIIIKGGLFTSLNTGLAIHYDEVDSIKLYGGTFRGGLSSGHAIKLFGGTEENFTDILAEGYIYDDVITPLSETGAVYLQEEEISVIENPNATTQEQTTTPTEDTNTTETTAKISNPATGDNILFYVTMFIVGLVGFTGTGLYIKKKIFN